MGTLVNPIGWRVNSNIYWKSNFFIYDDNLSIQTNNQKVYYAIIDSFLNKLNKELVWTGYLKFIRHFVYVAGKDTYVFVTFRFYRDIFLRSKTRRSYKYFRPEQRLRVFQAARSRAWKNWAFYEIIRLRARKKTLRKELWFLRSNEYLITQKRDVQKLVKAEEKLAKELWLTRRRLQRVRYKLLAPVYTARLTRVWAREGKVLRFFKRKKIRAYVHYSQKDKEERAKIYKPLFRYNAFGRRYTVQFKKRVRFGRRGTNRFRVLSARIPWRVRFYMRNREVFYKLTNPKKSAFVHKKKLPNLKRGRGVSGRVKSLSKYALRGTRRYQIKKKLRQKKKAKLRSSYFTYQRRLFGKRQLRRATVTIQKLLFDRRNRLRWKKRFKKSFRNSRRPKTWRPRKFQSSVHKWRWITPIRRDPDRVGLKSLLLIYFLLIPFLIEIKRFIIGLFVRLPNPGITQVYLLNASKTRSISAQRILEFIENFLKRRRRVTKIVKLFYKIMKILRFFRARYRLKGFKFLLAGRFLRRDRATYVWKTRGAVPLATKLSKIDFAARSIQMKYSRPIVKLWICRR